MEASWKVAGLFRADASKVATEISSLGEAVKPKDLVRYARDESSELHKCFEWDDGIAGEKYRELQAQKVLQLLVITPKVEEKEPVSYRIFVNTGDNSGKYKPLPLVVKRSDEYESLLKMAKRELQAFKKKYEMLKELEGIFNEIDLL